MYVGPCFPESPVFLNDGLNLSRNYMSNYLYIPYFLLRAQVTDTQWDLEKGDKVI